MISSSMKTYLNSNGQVQWDTVQQRWNSLKQHKISLANKHFYPQTVQTVKKLNHESQIRFLKMIISGLANKDSSVGVYVNEGSDYDRFAFYLHPIIKQYHKIQQEQPFQHDWNIPVGKYKLNNINPNLSKVSMRARVARNISGFKLPCAMNKSERIQLQNTMISIFKKFKIQGKYFSLTPGNPHLISEKQAEKLRKQHILFNDMTEDEHLVVAGFADDWPEGRGVWLSEDKTKMIWVGEEDHLRIISIIHGTDLGEVDASLFQLLNEIQSTGLKFMQHQKYGIITSCPTNIGTSKRQSIFGKFRKLTESGTKPQNLKKLAKDFGLQARGVGGQHSAMNSQGMADLSPSARFGTTEAALTRILYEGITKLYKLEEQTINPKL